MKDLYSRCDDCDGLIEEDDTITINDFYDVCPKCYKKNHKEKT